MTELKPCPFCGGQAGLYHGDSTDGYIKGTRYVEAFCGLCGARIRKFKREDAIEAWNNRPNPWYTGTPTEEGWYLCAYGDNFYCANYWEGGIWKNQWGGTLLAYQKIEPYKEN